MRALRVPLAIGFTFAALWVAGTGAQAQPYPPPTPTVIASISPSPSVPPPSGSPPPSIPPTVFPSRGPEPTPPSDLPITGADLARFVVIGGGLTAVGTALVRVARRSRPS